ncbi:TPA: phenylalanine--tRNA ligase subunit beta [Candidatus Gastranaerophilales bacterium HUM_6]|nr:phenylalanine--tRNA ligase beta subunit [Fusobacterium sp. CAG:815]DAA90357.1 MAG TPA: phenylalanine--tRNA ligase subunit beta [Candidatus Gastranaerophilales bacterium HUM_6]DAA94757.1 MAG TPA: phenylalanine--tRNA ligase subunit beta [Candidatus Gastranaerophilales bacterium HUM_7]DAB03920.1 MAG TPA: phenylalanine--tRNA ligase subunit beta [Candidatus Gastranaerophilales bacterium HUM_12]DAB06027.1 MAG TPA: phenylalanine--tRNA ligase subunit beta [Candidatus Gastranaerophilales bacterium HU
MQVSLNWLNEFVDLSNVEASQIAHELTMSGLEVEAVEDVKPSFTNIKTVKIEKIDAHPNSDRLHLVTVNTGSGLKTVVCGAQNIAEGQVVPYASVGSQVLDRKTGEMFTLTPAVIRGVESQGMLCSADELGVSDRNYQEEDGILILNRIFSDVQLGQDVKDVLGFEKDTVLDVAPTANRGDQMSVIGVARELSSLFNTPLKFNPIECTKDLSTDKFKVEIKDKTVCKYYSIALLKNIKTKPSPDWMKKRLLASGVRSINNVVDITNYVMLEYGCPLHAFDADKLDGYLCVRRAEDGEKLITLDEVERTLTTDSVLIATKDKGVCLGGVFGGANSEIDDNTTSIALEAAYFTPATNRKSARSAGYRSEASARFERGIDIEAVKPALMRAMQLLVEYADAEVVGVVEDGENKLEPIEITLRYAQIKRILGCEIAPERCINILENLGFKKLGGNDAAAKFLVPSFRAYDVTREIDLIEEIARINGYDKISPTLPSKAQTPTITLEEKVINKVNEIMLSAGLNEIQTSSLIGKPLLDKFKITYDDENAVKVLNAASEDYAMLRQTLAASVLNCMKYNFDNGQKNFWAYEIGKTYIKTAPADEKSTGVKETRVLEGVLTGEVQNSKWQVKTTVDFYTVKGILENLFKELDVLRRIKIVPIEKTDLINTHKALHPYRTAVIMLLGKHPLPIGYFGQVHPTLIDKLKLNQNAFLFKVDLTELIGAVKESVPRFKHIPQYPEVRRDIAFIINDEVSFDDIQKVIKSSVKQNIFKGSEIFDVYQGEHVEDGFKSVAFRIKMQDENATLTDEIIEQQMTSVREKLQKTYAQISFRE